VAKIEREFPAGARAAVLERLARLDLALAERQSFERIQTAILLLAHGDLAKLNDAAALAERDWRDVLVWSGLGDADWPERLDDELGP
jgi:hypothetical protein